jgi:glucokinase
MKRAVLVNGVPASGKSVVARLIASRRAWPLLSLDTIKEPFFEHIGVGDRAFNRKLGCASYQAIFDLIAAFPAGSITVVDAWFGFQPFEVLTRHLARAGIGYAMEIWCHAAPEIIAERYSARVGARPPGHPGIEYLPELIDLAGRAKPLGCFPCLAVDTAAPIDESALFAWLEANAASR